MAVIHLLKDVFIRFFFQLPHGSKLTAKWQFQLTTEILVSWKWKYYVSNDSYTSLKKMCSFMVFFKKNC
jgi:hypothetical protein